jgi:diaminohydroxyphosphoribosylaminopyrimidine deaminase/5-amino-6-(5-phosphoribosylamino)uracil reductase
MGQRRWTNVLVEGGSTLLGSLFDAGVIDEVHVFVAPCLAGGAGAPSPISGRGVDRIADAWRLVDAQIMDLAWDVYIHGFVSKDYPA